MRFILDNKLVGPPSGAYAGCFLIINKSYALRLKTSNFLTHYVLYPSLYGGTRGGWISNVYRVEVGRFCKMTVTLGYECGTRILSLILECGNRSRVLGCKPP